MCIVCAESDCRAEVIEFLIDFWSAFFGVVPQVVYYVPAPTTGIIDVCSMTQKSSGYFGFIQLKRDMQRTPRVGMR